MKKIKIFRVDDRLIHGQVIEGWIKYYKLENIFIVNDRVAFDPIQHMIFKSILPKGVNLFIYTVEDFVKNFEKKRYDNFLVLFESVFDLMMSKTLIDEDIDINIGCVANRVHSYQISDTVFLDLSEIQELCKLREKHLVTIKKLPWETSIEIMNFNKLITGKI
jgi:mannose/fructose/N-acetylgalactosamine-specific phosphotransferase system component IIB